MVINPPAIYGPPLSGRSDGESVDMVKRMANREMTPLCPMIGLSYADVRDIAAAHTLAAFHPAAQGRWGGTFLTHIPGCHPPDQTMYCDSHDGSLQYDLKQIMAAYFRYAEIKGCNPLACALSNSAVLMRG